MPGFIATETIPATKRTEPSGRVGSSGRVGPSGRIGPSGWFTPQALIEQKKTEPTPARAEQRRASDELLRAMAARMALALEVAQIGVWEWDFAAHKLVWDARMYAIYGIEAGTPIDSDRWKRTVHPDDLDQASGIFARAAQQGLKGKHQFRIVHPTAGVRFIETSEQLVLDAAGRPIACIGIDQDVTDRRRVEDAMRVRQAELEKLTLTDPLTGVGNRRKLDEDIVREVSRVRRYGGKLSFLIADVDHFKAVNDTFGHETGDAVMRFVAQTLRANVRDTDLVARYGGDEFCVVMPGTGQADARAVAERIRARLEQTIAPSLDSAGLTSTGVAQLEEGEDADSLLKRADRALLRAKKKGRNRVVSDLCSGRRPDPRRNGAGTRPAAMGEAEARFEAALPVGDGLSWLAGGAAWFSSMAVDAPASPPPFN
jgi:diguanylate cyclase (GGDEF)-like protein